jgi:uncharacterized protein
MLTSHEILLKYWHDARYEFSDMRISYVDRGAPGDRSCVRGREIRTLEPYYFEISLESGTKYIPYHRIRKIQYGNETIWER